MTYPDYNIEFLRKENERLQAECERLSHLAKNAIDWKDKDIVELEQELDAAKKELIATKQRYHDLYITNQLQNALKVKDYWQPETGRVEAMLKVVEAAKKAVIDGHTYYALYDEPPSDSLAWHNLEKAVEALQALEGGVE